MVHFRVPISSNHDGAIVIYFCKEKEKQENSLNNKYLLQKIICNSFNFNRKIRPKKDSYGRKYQKENKIIF